MKMVMQVSYAWLISFYWMLTPMVAPMVILPQTRGVFLGWLKTYVTVALWPMFFAFAERLALAIPWSAWLGAVRWGGSYLGHGRRAGSRASSMLADLQHHVLLRLPVDPDRELPDRVRRVSAVPHAVIRQRRVSRMPTEAPRRSGTREEEQQNPDDSPTGS